MSRPRRDLAQVLAHLYSLASGHPDPAPCWIWTGTLLKSNRPCFPSGERLGSRAPLTLLFRFERPDEYIAGGILRLHKTCHRHCVNPHHARVVSTSLRRRPRVKAANSDDNLLDLIEGAIATAKVATYDDIQRMFARDFTQREIYDALRSNAYLKERFLT